MAILFFLWLGAVKVVLERQGEHNLKANPTAVKSIHLVPLPKASVLLWRTNALPQIALQQSNIYFLVDDSHLRCPDKQPCRHLELRRTKLGIHFSNMYCDAHSHQESWKRAF